MNKPSDIIHLAFGFDLNYIIPFYVLITSIFHNNSRHKFVFHVITSGVSDDHKELLTEYIKSKGGNIDFYNSDESCISKFIIPESTHFTSAIYHRLFFPMVLSREITQYIYLDTDTLVVGDLGELYTINTGEYSIAATVDNGMVIREDLGIHSKQDYFNSGVMLVNTARWNDNNLTERISAFIIEKPELIRFGDQDGLNGILKKNWYSLENRYNIMTMDLPASLEKEETSRYLEDKVIIHFNGLNKPWEIICPHKLRPVYIHYFDLFFATDHACNLISRYFDIRFSRFLLEALEQEGEIDDGTLITFAFYLHIAWIKKVSSCSILPDKMTLVKTYYQLEDIKREKQFYGSLVAEFDVIKNSLMEIYTEIMNNSPGNDHDSPPWLNTWENICQNEITKYQMDRSSEMQLNFIIPEIINEKLGVRAKSKYILFYAISSILNDQ